MNQVSGKTRQDVMNVDAQSLQFRLPDATSTAEIVLIQAMEYCAEKMALDSAQAAIERLKQGDSAACMYCHYSVAKQLAQSLGALDQNLKSAYVFDYDATPEDRCFGKRSPITPLHLLVWADRKTDALNALVQSLDRALAQKIADLLGTSPTANVLDVQIIDDRDVETRVGYGALIASLYHRPMKVWER